MNWIDIAILVLIAAYCLYVIFAKKKSSCCGDCGKCHGCSHSNQ